MDLILYTIVDEATLNMVIYDDICEILGYESGVILKDKVLSQAELTNGLFAISVNVKAPNKECAWTGLDSQGVDLANYLYGEENILTQDEYDNLEFK